jgi:hypothetical protein
MPFGVIARMTAAKRVMFDLKLCRDTRSGLGNAVARASATDWFE